MKNKDEIIEINSAIHALVLALRIHSGIREDNINFEILQAGLILESSNGPKIEPEPNLSKEDVQSDAINLQVVALGACAITVDSVVERIFGKVNLNPISEFEVARVILYMIRCSYAHSPLKPKWEARNKIFQKSFKLLLEDVNFELDMPKLNGLGLENRHFEGIHGFITLIHYFRSKVASGLI